MTTLQGMDADTSRCVADHLAIIADHLGEALACADDGQDMGSVQLAFKAVWKLRCELGFTSGAVVADLAEPESEATE